MFRLVERPTLMPACTLLRSTVGPVVDTEVTIRNGGRVYISELEAGEIGRHFEMLTKEAARQLQARIAELEAENAELKARAVKVRDDILAAV